MYVDVYHNPLRVRIVGPELPLARLHNLHFELLCPLQLAVL